VGGGVGCYAVAERSEGLAERKRAKKMFYPGLCFGFGALSLKLWTKLSEV